MKKLLLLTLVLLGGVMQVSAADDIYLRTDYRNVNKWSTDDADYKFTYVKSENNEDIYTYIINASDIKTSDVWFRIHINGWGAVICPYTNTGDGGGSYTYSFTDNGQNETEGAKYEKTYYQGETYSWGIPHSTIKASQYRITLYRGNKEQSYKNENCKVLWIKVDIVSMPATVSALGYSTFSCGRALDLDNATGGLKAYKASVSDGKVVLTKVSGKVAAETGLLLAGTANASETIPVVTTAEGTDISTTNLLKACVNGGTVTKSGTDDKYHYFLAGSTAENIGFYNLATDTECGAGKAYLETTSPLATEGTGGARASWVFQDEEQETDGIQTAKAVTYNDNVYYDLQGRKVAYPTKGLYIINGKKVVVK